MGTSRDQAAGFVESYGRTWERWDVSAWVDLFTDEIVYVDHPTQKTVVGKSALASYIRGEAAEQGEVSVRMGLPVIDGDHVAAEYWVTGTSAGEAKTLAGGFIARLAPDGRCSYFREYWFYIDGHASPYDGWGN